MEKAADETLCVQLLRYTNSAEARKWLRQGKEHDIRYLGELGSTDESLSLVDEIYAAGAQRVVAVDIDVTDRGQNTGKLVIELPPDGQWRAQCFDLAGRISQELGFDPTPDVGQKYLFVMLD